MEWIPCSKMLPPKDGLKFIFHYFCGIGIGHWAHKYTYSPDRTDSWDGGEEAYILVLWPSEARDGEGIYEWNDEKMIDMEISWMKLPEPPKDS